MNGETVLVTGGSGFLGQHVVRELQERDSRVTEIRVLDLRPYRNRLGHAIKKPIVSVVADITDPAACRAAFADVSCVFHCAALVSYDTPADTERLNSVNIKGTENVLRLCQDACVPRLVFTSTAEVTLTPFFNRGFFCAVINQTEAKAKASEDPTRLVFKEYAASKLRAEKLVCQADGTLLKSGALLRTVSLRPALLYGEEDRGLLPLLLSLADCCDQTFPRVSGAGGKHQLCYAGNAGWAHICAKDVLKDSPNSIGGLPIFVTDDTPISDITRFCVRMTQPAGEATQYHHSWWYLPSFLSYLLAILIEPILVFLLPFFNLGPLPMSPSAAITFLGSIILYNRLRADTHLRYSPVHKYQHAHNRAVKYYSQETRVKCLTC